MKIWWDCILVVGKVYSWLDNNSDTAEFIPYLGRTQTELNSNACYSVFFDGILGYGKLQGVYYVNGTACLEGC